MPDLLPNSKLEKLERFATWLWTLVTKENMAKLLVLSAGLGVMHSDLSSKTDAANANLLLVDSANRIHWKKARFDSDTIKWQNDSIVKNQKLIIGKIDSMLGEDIP